MFLAQCAHDIATSYGLQISLLLAGLVGGFSHCVLMCSPFVLAQTEGQGKKMQSWGAMFLFPYHLGRMTTYVALAVLLSTVLNLAFVFSDMKGLIAAPLLMLAGVIFIVTAFPRLADLFPWAMRARLGVPYKWIQFFITRLKKRQNALGRYILGVLLGFMPCGLVVSALMASASAPTVFESATAMAAFTIGTIPALIMVAFGGKAISMKYPKATHFVSRGGMVVSAVWLFTLAGSLML